MPAGVSSEKKENRVEMQEIRSSGTQIRHAGVLLQPELENFAVWVTPFGDAKRRSIQCRSSEYMSSSASRSPNTRPVIALTALNLRVPGRDPR